jgi:serine/threonine-protein kinase
MAPVPLRRGTFSPGSLIAGKYRIVERLGRGAMGTVWRAEHLVLRAPVAIKVLEAELLDPRRDDVEQTLQRFLREAQAAAMIRSPNVVQILDYGNEGDRPYIVLELLEGETLAARLERVGKLPFDEMLSIVTQIGRALARAHELSISHRDLKPSNVFLVRNQDDEVTKVLDLGLAKPFDLHGRGKLVQSLTPTGLLLGTPYYMSPEQASAKKTLDGRTDLWALGIIAFESLCGRLPYEKLDWLPDLLRQIARGETATPSSVATVPEGFDAWFAEATRVEPDERFQTAKEMVDALRQLGAQGAAVMDRSTAAPREPAPVVPGTRAAPAPPVATDAPAVLPEPITVPLVPRPPAGTVPPAADGRSTVDRRRGAAVLQSSHVPSSDEAPTRRKGHDRADTAARAHAPEGPAHRVERDRRVTVAPRSAVDALAETVPFIETGGRGGRAPALDASHAPVERRAPHDVRGRRSRAIAGAAGLAAALAMGVLWAVTRSHSSGAAAEDSAELHATATVAPEQARAAPGAGAATEPSASVTTVAPSIDPSAAAASASSPARAQSTASARAPAAAPRPSAPNPVSRDPRVGF